MISRHLSVHNNKSRIEMPSSRRNVSPGRMRKGPVVVKVLCGVCVIQILFTVYVAVKVLNATLRPDQYVFSGGPSALSDRNREVALAVGDLDLIDMEQPIEFFVDDKNAAAGGDSYSQGATTIMKNFALRPLSVLSKSFEDEQHMNRLIVSGNIEVELEPQRSKRSKETAAAGGDNTKQTGVSTAAKLPLLKKFAIRPLDTGQLSSTAAGGEDSGAEHIRGKLSRAFPRLTVDPSTQPRSQNNDNHINTNNTSSKIASNFTSKSQKAVHIPRSHSSQQSLTSGKFPPSIKSASASLILTEPIIQKQSQLNTVVLSNGDIHLAKDRVKTASIGSSGTNPAAAAQGLPAALLLKRVPGESDTAVMSSGSNTAAAEEVLEKARVPEVLVYGKAAIGRYLWSHVLQGELEADTAYPGTLVGKKTVEGVHLLYREGPGLVPGPSSPPAGVRGLVIVLNGRTDDKVTAARHWLDHLQQRQPRPAVLLLLLGSERCENGWLQQYVSSGLVRAVLLTYDDPIIDNVVYFQWPLGVATYREFPRLSAREVGGRSKARLYSCSLHATLHNDSSTRRQLALLLRPYSKQRTCHTSFRNRWQSSENSSTMSQYVWSLLESDLALCPAGYNAETYRLYEAMEAGAVPVLHDRQPSSGGQCDSEPFRLLKEAEAPVLWVNSWYELQGLLDRERRLRQRGKTDRRKRIRRWYAGFKRSMSERLLSLVNKHLLA